ncbi:MAG: MBOAT family protein [Lachnospiraceae bacterium]|nr:MBOAT family protein [Lachnospiraceae bacterium]
MIFSTIEFAIFMTVVFLAYWSLPQKYRSFVLLAANLYFYAFYDVKYLIVLLITTVISYCGAIFMEKAAPEHKKRLLILCIGSCLLLLFVFKYLNFTIYTVEKVLSVIGMPMQDSTLRLILPIGISFYTFEMISYLVDVYRGKISAERSFLFYLLFVSFFPNISSGPIERAGHFLPQLREEKKFDYDRTVYGTRLLLLGLFKKIVFADMLAKYVNAVFDHVPEMTGICFLWATLLYTFQIYCDFSGYSDMALGLAGMLGFELPVNFRQPYFASSIKEFWGRWHISLSTWLRDYVYIPLGGNRCSKRRRDLNLLATFLISGLWHGASWTFVLWGGIHGVCQVLEDRIGEKRNCSAILLCRFFRKNLRGPRRGTAAVKSRRERRELSLDANENQMVLEKSGGQQAAAVPGQEAVQSLAGRVSVQKLGATVLTFIIVSFAWLFFRANSLSEAARAVRYMFSDLSIRNAMLRMTMSWRSVVKTFLAIAAILVFDYFSLKQDLIEAFGRLKMPLRWIVYFGMGILVLAMAANNGDAQEFIYFKF